MKESANLAQSGLNILVVIAILTASSLRVCEAKSTGAPVSESPGICSSMIPVGHYISSSSDPIPYTITTDVNTFSASQQVTVSISTDAMSDPFKGIFLQMRNVDDDAIVGTWNVEDTTNFQAVSCDGASNNALTHKNSNPKGLTNTFKWNAPATKLSDVKVVATLVQEYQQFWVMVQGPTIQHVQISNACNPNPCLAGGTCELSGGSFMCNCIPPYAGPTCHYLVFPCDSNPCQNGGTCEDVNQESEFVCSCAPGYAGITCDNQVSNACNPNPCLAGGTCELSGGSFMCNCIPPYAGPTCHYLEFPCDSNPCQNGGTCEDVNQESEFVCSCAPGYAGTTCDIQVFPCDSSPCLNGGVCQNVDQNTEFLCECSGTGYTGRTCADVVACSSNPCMNGGTCIGSNQDSEYTCNCPVGYAGTRCGTAVSPCEENSCENGATCNGITGGEAYTCTCLPEYTGTLCETSLATTQASTSASTTGHGTKITYNICTLVATLSIPLYVL
ncbi:fibropellin-1-like isoform X2 [Lytechinus variegatus]|uniref:fibropellin-1-like isoform X2 n=1 Tax=Lytechinus variegatus TaxID=7654 RepID=UPI001BB10FDE|nr:fibropellin-1-like isoform X2 [Lytechinus variegatus]